MSTKLDITFHSFRPQWRKVVGESKKMEEEEGKMSWEEEETRTEKGEEMGQNEIGKPRKTKSKMKKKKTKVRVSGDEEDEALDLPPECCSDAGHEVKKKATGLKKQMSIPWFQKINMSPEQYKQLCFSESLLMVDEAGNVSGKMYIRVTQADWGDRHCLCVHSGSYGTPDEGMECGTTITGFVTFDMKTLQEFVHEWAVVEGKVTERKIFIMREDHGINVQIMLIKEGEILEQKTIKLNRFEQQLLVTECGNILLLRLLILEKMFQGGMELKTITFKGTVVKNKYTALGSGWENVKGNEVRTWSIRRTVEFDFGDRLWDSMFNKFSRLVLRCQPENVHALIPLWFEPARNKKGKLVMYPPYIWACDAELYAKYLLKKDELAAEHRSYLLDHPELQALISDFLQAVLLRKPKNLIPFAQQYFESFLKYHPESLDPSAASSSSSISSSSSEHAFEWGEWDGEGAADNNFYKIPPIRSLDGLEKVSSYDLYEQDEDGVDEDVTEQ